MGGRRAAHSGCTALLCGRYTVDSTDPVVNIIQPSANVSDNYVTTTTKDIKLNWTSSDATIGLDTCWFYNITSAANQTSTCGDNQTFTLPYSTTPYTYRVYANDTFGNEGTATATYKHMYKLLENSEDYKIKYKTPAPEIKEEEISDMRKRVVVSGPDELEYENVLSFSDLPQKLKPEDLGKLKFYRIVMRDGKGCI